MLETEAKIEKKLKTEVEKLGGYCIKLLSSHITGLPDRLCLLPGGRLIFIELKATGKRPTAIQKAIHRRIRLLGFQVEVFDSTRQISELCTELRK